MANLMRAPDNLTDENLDIGDPKPPTAIKTWALIGALLMAIEVAAIVGWLISGPKSTASGPDPVPLHMMVAIWIIEVIGPILTIWFLWHFVIRPWRRDGRLSTDGLLVLAFQTLFWQDTMINYINPYVVYNTGVIQFGSWDGHILGWASPRGNSVAEPVLFMGCYIWAVMGGVLAGTAFMRWLRRRYPQISPIKLVGAAFVFFMVVFTAIEFAHMFLGLYTYPGAIRSLSVFAGHYYQYPVYESVFWGGTMTALLCFRFFRNDKGESLVERGSEQVGGGAKGSTAMRFLALAGAANFAMLVIYTIPVIAISLHGSGWPDDITSRSYFRNEQCGAGTPYACPQPEHPSPHGRSDGVGPTG